MNMLGKREHENASCWLRMMPDLPMQLRDSVRLVHDLKTDKGMRGKGQGTKLMQLVCSEADKAQKVLILMPNTQVLQKWYNKFGFEVTQTEPAVVMVRKPSEIETRGNDGIRIS